MSDSTSRRVLVVDDNRDAADMVASLLSLLGHEVLTAYDGRSALAQARDFQPDVVLVDLVMSGMDGFEFARQLRELGDRDELKPLKIVALTGFGQPPVLAATDAAGFDAHITKPATVETLTAAVTG